MHKFTGFTIAVLASTVLLVTSAFGQMPCTLAYNMVALDVVGLPGGSAGAIANPGTVEFDPAPGDTRMSLDVEAATIRLFNNSANTNILFIVPTTYTVALADSSPVFITGVAVAINGVSDFKPSYVSFTPHSVQIDVSSTTWHPTDDVVVTLALSCPPCTAIGKQASLAVTGTLSGNASSPVVAGRTEFSPAPGDTRFYLDVETPTVTMGNSSMSNVLFAAPTAYTVTIGLGTAFTIVGISPVINGVTGMTTANFAFGSQTIRIDATGTTWHPGDSVVVTYLTECLACSLDADGNAFVDALTDGLVLIRAMFGLTGTTVTNNAIGPNATRSTWPTIRSFLNSSCGTSFAP